MIFWDWWLVAGDWWLVAGGQLARIWKKGEFAVFPFQT